jgi:hypothetical protein
MNAFNPIATMQRLEAAGIKLQQAEALAGELHGVMTQVMTHEQLLAAENRIVIKLGAVVAFIVTLATTIIVAAIYH